MSDMEEVWTALSDDVLQINVRPGVQITHSDFPHPLVTVDFGSQEEVVAITFVGPMKKIIEAHTIEMVLERLKSRAYGDPDATKRAMLVYANSVIRKEFQNER